jgi:hypothetical protein
MVRHAVFCLDDACDLRQGGRISCRIFQESQGRFTFATYDFSAQLRALGGKFLMGDMNGDGRDDFCLYNHGRLLCGFFRPAGGLPIRTQEWSFGLEGDVPVIGDVDGR